MEQTQLTNLLDILKAAKKDLSAEDYKALVKDNAGQILTLIFKQSDYGKS